MMLTEYLDRAAEAVGDEPSLIRPDGTVSLTHRGLQELSHRIARALLRDGLRPGDRVGVLSSNDPAALAGMLGIIRAGGVWTAVNTASGAPDQAAFLSLVGCRRLVHHPDLGDRAAQLEEQVPTLESTVRLGAADPDDDWDDWLDGERESPAPTSRSSRTGSPRCCRRAAPPACRRPSPSRTGSCTSCAWRSPCTLRSRLRPATSAPRR